MNIRNSLLDKTNIKVNFCVGESFYRDKNSFRPFVFELYTTLKVEKFQLRLLIPWRHFVDGIQERQSETFSYWMISSWILNNRCKINWFGTYNVVKKNLDTYQGVTYINRTSNLTLLFIEYKITYNTEIIEKSLKLFEKRNVMSSKFQTSRHILFHEENNAIGLQHKNVTMGSLSA